MDFGSAELVEMTRIENEGLEMQGFEYTHDMLPMGIVLIPIAAMVIAGFFELFKKPRP